MKMFLVVYENFLDAPTLEAFKQAGYKSYTKMKDVTGEGKHLPKLGNRMGRGKNDTLLFAVPDEEIPHIIEVVQSLKTRYPVAGYRAFTFPLEQCL